MQLAQACDACLERHTGPEVEEQRTDLRAEEVIRARRAQRSEARCRVAGEELEDDRGVGVVADERPVGRGESPHHRGEPRRFDDRAASARGAIASTGDPNGCRRPRVRGIARPARSAGATWPRTRHSSRPNRSCRGRRAPHRRRSDACRAPRGARARARTRGAARGATPPRHRSTRPPAAHRRRPSRTRSSSRDGDGRRGRGRRTRATACRSTAPRHRRRTGTRHTPPRCRLRACPHRAVARARATRSSTSRATPDSVSVPRSPPEPFTASTRVGDPVIGSASVSLADVFPPAKFVTRLSDPRRWERASSSPRARSRPPAALDGHVRYLRMEQVRTSARSSAGG